MVTCESHVCFFDVLMQIPDKQPVREIIPYNFDIRSGVIRLSPRVMVYDSVRKDLRNHRLPCQTERLRVYGSEVVTENGFSPPTVYRATVPVFEPKELGDYLYGKDSYVAVTPGSVEWLRMFNRCDHQLRYGLGECEEGYWKWGYFVPEVRGSRQMLGTNVGY